MRSIAFVNEKGGSCKTTLAVNVAAYLAEHGRGRVLLVDLDPQGQAGKCLGLDVKAPGPTTLDLLLDNSVRVSDAVRPTRISGLDAIVSNKTLTEFSIAAAGDENRATKLASKVAGLTDYAVVVFDTPPSLGLLTLNVLVATTEIVIPVSLTYLALDGCAEIVETVEAIQKNYGKSDLRISLVVPVLYRNTRLANAILQKLRDFFGPQLAKTVIGYNVTVDEAQSMGQTIWEYAPRTKGAQAFEALAAEIRDAGA